MNKVLQKKLDTHCKNRMLHKKWRQEGIKHFGDNPTLQDLIDGAKYDVMLLVRRTRLIVRKKKPVLLKKKPAIIRQLQINTARRAHARSIRSAS